MRTRLFLLLFAAFTAAACDDDFGVQPWNATPDTVTLFSLSRTDLIGFPSGYDFTARRIVEIEAPGAGGSWDVALAGTSAQLFLIPASAFQGQGALRTAIAPITNLTFAAVEEAPGDTARYTREAVPLVNGGVYVVRSRRIACGFGSGQFYAKIHAVNVDPAAGSAKFAVVVNPYCNDRSFVPPED